MLGVLNKSSRVWLVVHHEEDFVMGLRSAQNVNSNSLSQDSKHRACILEPNPTHRFIRGSTRGGKLMLKKLALATAAVGLLCLSASADYYIVQEKATKKCKVVETKPA